MPLTPKVRPASKTSAAEASPTVTPPAKEAQGVKCVQSISI
jgi:hypothetical protein